jgi:hypothetical protein
MVVERKGNRLAVTVQNNAKLLLREMIKPGETLMITGLESP